MLRFSLNLLCVLSIILSACGPVAQPTASEVGRTPAPAAATAIASPAPSATATATPSPTQPSAVSTPLARVLTERPTPIPAPTCFPAGLPANATKDDVTSIALASASRILVSVYTPALSRTNVYVSDDSGLSWSAGRALSDFIGRLVPSPNFEKDRIVFAVGAGGVYRSLSGGSAWAAVTPSTWFTTTPMTRQFVISPNFEKDRTVLLGSRTAPRGVFASTDGGATWIDWLVDAVDALLISPNYAIDRAVWAARNDDLTFRRDVIVTFNQGDAWESVRTGTAQPFAISPAFAQDSTIIWMEPGGGLFVSRNGDKVAPLIEKAEADILKIWKSDPQAGWVVAGEQPLTDLVFSPNFAQDRTAFATTDQLMVVTHDGGASWSPLCDWGFNPQKPEALHFNHLAISEEFGSDQTLYAGGHGTRIVVSRDGGRSWAPIPLK